MMLRAKKPTAILAALLISGLAISPCATLNSKGTRAGVRTTPAHNKGIGNVKERRVTEALDKLPLQFEEVRDRGSNSVKFAARAIGMHIAIMPTEAVMRLNSAKDQAVGPPSALSLTSGIVDARRRDAVAAATIPRSEPTVLRLKLIGANRRARVIGENQLATRTNYLIGNDASRWQVGVANYGQVRVEHAYRGIDVIYYGSRQQLEYDFRVAPGADFKAIRLRFAGACRVWLDETGDLLIESRAGTLRHRKPDAYQQINGARKEIPAHYVFDGRNNVGFALENYDRNLPVVIDPVLAYSSFFGGEGDDAINGIALDSNGNVYATGTTDSSDLPTTPGSFQSHSDEIPYEIGFIAKFDLTTNALIYSTYIGGSKPLPVASSHCNAIAVDSSGNAYVTGRTDAADFPTTRGAFQTALASKSFDAFVVKLNTTGSALVYSTYLGSSKSTDPTNSLPFVEDVGLDEGLSIAVDLTGNAFITGRTTGSDFPTTPGALKTIHNNDVILQGGVDAPIRAFGDAFITKLNPPGTTLLYSTYLGGRGEDSGSGIAVDAFGNAYVIGTTEAGDFPIANALQGTLAGRSDAFLTKLSVDGSGLVYSTYIGGSGEDGGKAIALDGVGNAYVTGTTSSSDLRTTAGAFQPASFDVNLFKSTNAGASWFAGNVGIPTDVSLSEVVVDPANSSILYANASNFVFNSTDGGRSWKNTRDHPETISSSFPTKLITFDPKRPSTVYGVWETGFFLPQFMRSLDSGRTWQQINSNFPPSGFLLSILSLTVDPVNTSTLYADTNVGLFKMTDGGNWVERDKGLFNETGFLTFLSVDPRNPARLLGAAGSKLFMSNNGGKKWVPTSLGDALIFWATFDLATPNVYASGEGLFKSTDDGDSWREIETDLPDIGKIVLDPANPTVLYTTSWTGTFKSTDGGSHWSAINNGLRTGAALSISAIESITIDPRNTATLYAAGAGSGEDVFVAKLNSAGASFDYFTYLGGTNDERPSAIAVDLAGNAYITGQTGSEDFPVRKPLQLDKTFRNNDAFVTKLNPDGRSVAYSTYLGGSSLDIGSGTAVDRFGVAYVAGVTFSNDFPLANPMQSSFGTTNGQAFLLKIADADSSLPAPVILSVSPQRGSSAGQNLVTIAGSNFLPGARVRLGGVPVTPIALTSNQITAIANPRPAGIVNVVVNNPDGQSAALTRGYTYLPIPEIVAVDIEDKLLRVSGEGFDKGAVILMNGAEQETGQPLSTRARLLLTSRKAAKKIAPGQSVTVQVRNASGLVSGSIVYTRPAG